MEAIQQGKIRLADDLKVKTSECQRTKDALSASINEVLSPLHSPITHNPNTLKANPKPLHFLGRHPLSRARGC